MDYAILLNLLNSILIEKYQIKEIQIFKLILLIVVYAKYEISKLKILLLLY